MVTLDIGRIIWAVCPGTRGKGKRRPMVILTSTAEIERTGLAFVVVCSSKFTEPVRDDEVLLPGGIGVNRSITKLKKPTVAICGWKRLIPVGGIRPEDYGGVVPTHLVIEIYRKIGIHIPSPEE